jgi:Histidine kinase-, DNA gyrase B-, and HSP90-like ATPase
MLRPESCQEHYFGASPPWNQGSTSTTNIQDVSDEEIRQVNLPHDGSLATTMLNVDYKLADAIAELIDNSIDANANNILCRIVRTNGVPTQLLVIDDGDGISREKITDAMTFAKKRDYGTDDIGMYGVGLKSASLNMAHKMDLVSRPPFQNPCGMRWTKEGADLETASELDPNWCTSMIDELTPTLPWPPEHGNQAMSFSGTIVQWSEIEEFQLHAISGEPSSKFEDKLMLNIANRLSLIFHRPLEREKERKSIFVDIQDSETRATFGLHRLKAINPFNYPKSGHPAYPKVLPVEVANGQRIEIRLHIWPKGLKTRDFMIPTESGTGASAAQGLYVYKGDRLVMSGKWADLEGHEAHKLLARAEIDLPKSPVAGVRINFNKTAVTIQPSLARKILSAKAGDGTTFKSWVSDAQDVDRAALASNIRIELPNPRGMVPTAVKREILDATTHSPDVGLTWAIFDDDDVFRIVDDLIYVNEDYRDVFTSGSTTGSKGYSLSMTLLVLALRDVVGKRRGKNIVALEEALLRVINIAARENS